jgi:cysteine synthase A
VEKVGEKDGAGGYLGTRLARVRQLCGELDSSYWTNQYANPDAALAHQQLTGEELCRSFARIDYLFVGVGTGATLAGLSNRLKLAFPAIRVVAVDAEGSVVFGGPPRPRHLPGLGSSIRPPMVGQAQVDDVVIVSERDAVLGCHELLRRHGLYAGGSTGSVYAAVRRYFGRHHGPRPTVVFVSADRGSPYAETVYNPAWVNNVLGLDTSAIAGGPGDRG